jgi:hypothetical protein
MAKKTGIALAVDSDSIMGESLMLCKREFPKFDFPNAKGVLHQSRDR